jgi:hypothetical protein
MSKCPGTLGVNLHLVKFYRSLIGKLCKMNTLQHIYIYIYIYMCVCVCVCVCVCTSST